LWTGHRVLLVVLEADRSRARTFSVPLKRVTFSDSPDSWNQKRERGLRRGNGNRNFSGEEKRAKPGNSRKYEGDRSFWSGCPPVYAKMQQSKLICLRQFHSQLPHIRNSSIPHPRMRTEIGRNGGRERIAGEGKRGCYSLAIMRRSSSSSESTRLLWVVR
jgi:hypothetical protein